MWFHFKIYIFIYFKAKIRYILITKVHHFDTRCIENNKEYNNTIQKVNKNKERIRQQKINKIKDLISITNNYNRKKYILTITINTNEVLHFKITLFYSGKYAYYALSK